MLRVLCCTYVASMFYACRPHVACMLHVCCTHVAYMLRVCCTYDPCMVHVCYMCSASCCIYMLHVCCMLYAACMVHVCCVYVASALHACCVNVRCMLRVWCVHVAAMLYVRRDVWLMLLPHLVALFCETCLCCQDVLDRVRELLLRVIKIESSLMPPPPKVSFVAALSFPSTNLDPVAPPILNRPRPRGAARLPKPYRPNIRIHCCFRS